MSRFEGIDSYAPPALVGVNQAVGCSCPHAQPGTQSVGWGADHVMTENERRNADVLTREDVMVRGLSIVGLVALFLLILLIVNS